MTSWPSKSILQRLLDLAGLRYTTSEKSGPSWQSMLRNFLSSPLSFLGWTTAMLFWLDFHQTQSNLYKWFRMQRHDWSSMSPKEPMLHLSSSHCTGYQWQLASSSRHWCLHTERPQAQHPPTSAPTYESTSPPEVWDLLVSDALWYHHREAQNHSPEHSHSPFLDGGIIFPPLSGMLDPCQSSSNNWKLISFGTTWLHPKLVLKRKKKKSFPLSFSPSLASLYLFEQWLRLGVNPISLSYPFPLPLPLSFARSRESKGCPNSHFDRGVGLRARGRYPLKPSIFASLLETKGYPEHTAQPATMSARSSRESHFRLK